MASCVLLSQWLHACCCILVLCSQLTFNRTAMTLFAVLYSSSDSVAACLSVLLMSKAHCTDRRICVLLSMLLYAWFLEVPTSAELCVPVFLGWLFPCFPPKGEQYWAEQKEVLHRWIASNCTKDCHRPRMRIPKKGPPCQDGERSMAVFLKYSKAHGRWTAEDDKRADAAIAAKGGGAVSSAWAAGSERERPRPPAIPLASAWFRKA